MKYQRLAIVICCAFLLASSSCDHSAQRQQTDVKHGKLEVTAFDKKEYAGGETITIRWNKEAAGNKLIDVFFKTSSDEPTPIATVKNTGKYAWELPSINAKELKIILKARDSDGAQLSEAETEKAIAVLGLQLTEPTESRLYEPGEPVVVKWQSGKLSDVALYFTYANGVIKLVARNLPDSASREYSLPLPESEYRLANNMKIAISAKNEFGDTIVSKWSAAFTVNNHPNKNEKNDASKILEITNQAYDAYEGNSDCGTHARKMLELVFAYGYSARFLNVFLNHWGDTHVMVEVFVASLGKWVAFDPTFSQYYVVNGHPASGYEMHRALTSGKLDAMGYVKSDDNIHRFENYYVNGLFLFKNFEVTLGDEYNFCYADKYSLPRPQCPLSLSDHNLLYLPPGNVKIYQQVATFKTDSGNVTRSLSDMLTNQDFDARKFIKSPAYPLGDVFRPIFYHDEEYMPGGTFDTDADGDGIADGWSSKGVVAASLVTDDAVAGRAAQKVEFGADGGELVYAYKTRDDVPESEGYQFMGFVKLVGGEASILMPPNGSCCAGGTISELSVIDTRGDWNYLHGGTFTTKQNKKSVRIIAGPGALLLLDEFHLLRTISD